MNFSRLTSLNWFAEQTHGDFHQASFTWSFMHCKIMRSFSSFFTLSTFVSERSLYFVFQNKQKLEVYTFDTGNEFSHARAFVEI